MIFIRYYHNLIVDDSVDVEIAQFKKCIDEGIAFYNIYVICVSDVGNSLVEILSSSDLIKTINSSKNYGVIAVAKGKKNALLQLCDIIKRWLKTHKDLSNLKSYYNDKCY